VVSLPACAFGFAAMDASIPVSKASGRCDAQSRSRPQTGNVGPDGELIFSRSRHSGGVNIAGRRLGVLCWRRN